VLFQKFKYIRQVISADWRKSWPAFLILVSGAVFYLALANRHDIGFFEDDALYTLGARSLLTGHYRDLTGPQSLPEVHILPGFPAVLVPFVAVSSGHWNRLKVIPWLLSVCAGFMAWILYQRWLPIKPAYAALALFVLGPLTIFLSDILLSEWWLVCLSLAAILLIREIETGAPNVWKKIALAGVLSWAALTRPEGILLSVALAGTLLFRLTLAKRFGWIVLVPFMVLSAWLMRNHIVSGRISSYTQYLGLPDGFHILKTLDAVGLLALGTFPVMDLGKVWLALIGVLMLIIGLRSELSERRELWRQIVLGYVFLFLLLRFIWPYFDGRYFLPLLPFLGVFTVQGCLSLSPGRASRLGAWLIGGLLLVILYEDIYSCMNWKSDPMDVLPKHSLTFIQNHVPPSFTVLTNKGGMMTLYTGRLNSGSVLADTPDQFVYDLLKTGTSYIWVRRQSIAMQMTQDQWIRVDRWVNGWPAAFPVVFNDPAEASVVYHVVVSPSFMPAYRIYLDARRALQGNSILKARKRLDEALHLFPEFPGALNDYASLLLESGETKRSEKYLLSALRLRQNFGLARFNLARVYEQENKLSLAKNALDIAWQNADGPEESVLRGWIQEEQKKLQTRPD